jgi:hypothetical protein
VPRVGVSTTITLTITDPNPGEVLEGEILINGTSIALSEGPIVTTSFTFPGSGVYNLLVVGSDGFDSDTKSLSVEVVPQLADDGTAIELSDELTATQLSLLQNVGSTTTIEEGSEVLNRMASALSGQDLTGAMHVMSSMVLSGNNERKSILDPDSDIYIDIESVVSSEQTVVTNPEETTFGAALNNVPLGNKIVFGTIPLNLDTNTPVDSVGKLMSIDMYSGATRVEDGFSIKLTVEKVYNPNKDQFLYVQDPETGEFDNSQVSPQIVGDDLQFNLTHFSVYVVVEQEKTENQTGATSVNEISPFSGTGGEPSAGGGCLLKR